MSISFLDSNLALLRKRDPALFESILSVQPSKSFTLIRSRSGHSSLMYCDEAGNKKQIDSNYDPVDEASRYMQRLEVGNSINFFVMGLGLGYQVSEIIRQTSREAKIYIFEKDPELFALAIREADFSSVFDHPGVRMFIDTNPKEFGTLIDHENINFTLNNYCVVEHKALVNRNIEYFGILLREIENYFKESRINLYTQKVHSKLYYKNIFNNIKNLKDSPGIVSLQGCLADIPAIVCSAGPSLDKNIQLLKSNRENYFLIAVATALKPLLKNGIEPDVVFSIDPDELTISSFDFVAGSGKAWLVYNAAVPKPVSDAFPGRKIAFDLNISLAEWFQKHSKEKGNLGKITSVAHSAFNFANYLACSPVILIGQDLSFHRHRQHCLHSFYYDENVCLIKRIDPIYQLNRLKYLGYGQNLTQCVDVFGCQTTSTLSMESYNRIFSYSIDPSKTNINATEAGVPIRGMKTLSLKEALFTYCNKSIKKKCDGLFETITYEQNTTDNMYESISSLIRDLKAIRNKAVTIKSQYESKPDSQSKHSFITAMANLYKDVLKDKDTALLLQGYDFEGFSEWYRSNCEIINKKELQKDKSFLDEEYERDKKFLPVLMESAEFLLEKFEKSLLLYKS